MTAELSDKELLDGKTILIVEDDCDMMQAIQIWFESICEATYLTASDGNTALKLATEKKPDIMILDLMLPQRSGFLVSEKLKHGKPAGSKPWIIMITGNPGKRHRDWGFSLGADDYLIKPFKMETLQSAVVSVVRKYSK